MSESPHILVVEDDRDISRLVGRYLRDNDCRVPHAGNGHEMHEVMLSNRIDLVVLDVMPPFVQGEREGETTDSGLGLGLSIAREIVTAQGGTLTLLDREPRGLAVRIDLPAWPEHADNLAKIA